MFFFKDSHIKLKENDLAVRINKKKKNKFTLGDMVKLQKFL